MSTALTGTTALVTGASGGIGAATALSLAAQGANVALAARRKDRLDELVERIKADGGTAVAIETDITDRTQATAMIEQTVAAFGGLDTLVNNAGIMLLGPAESAPIEEWDRMIALNVQGLLYATHAALPHLLAAAVGPRATADIVNISSLAGRVPIAGSAVYSLTKHGVGAFTEALRQEVTGRHVRVSLIEPGPVATELFTHIRPEILEAGKDAYANATLLHAEDIADTITYVVTRPARVVMSELLVRPDGSQW
ncbi:NADP-dependent 3-hydroxy acid dehydrogenase YdfG [Streptomyces sp. B3I7]|uniref:SDR family NAD(P)-dependent oxidoreductase n=1 Tax=unclassified Streptomyces TaxID=2593676 RepID=UPI0027809537|nr:MULTISPECIES: SDR family NAD(P)-dependent oxidoreductase [unclassified Streptomyces]MDQ0784948.1 NADP-dependent 3-hydroxy acid dehydrogenase YdfG [Streptomyces sp. B3I8]MDQ0808731.1 NADP-dependent 3-hydroxy acid dehydrogenase YdfG [Streptomyces sp. B3I7]